LFAGVGEDAVEQGAVGGGEFVAFLGAFAGGERGVFGEVFADVGSLTLDEIPREQSTVLVSVSAG